MAVEGIDIDIREVVDVAERMISLNATMEEVLKCLDSEMKGTVDIWDSKAQQLLEQKYNKLDVKKEQYCKDLQTYAQFLLNVAKEYGYTEKTINDNASNFV